MGHADSLTGMEVPLELVRAVRPAVDAHARRTPLLESTWLSERTGRRVLLKCESLQETGSFKLRGALAALDRMAPELRERGVFTASTGNHGQALAFAAAKLGVPCTVVVPRGAPENKVGKIRSRGAEVIPAPTAGYDAAQEWALGVGAPEGATYVSPYEDAAVAAGNGGTTALEILEDAPDVDAFVVPTGGGGLVVGVGAVARALAPDARVIAVNPEASAALWRSREEGRAYTTLDETNGGGPTIADGVEGGVGAENYRLAETLVDEVRRVPEAEIESAMGQLFVRERLVVEGAGALGVAAVLAAPPEARCVAVIVTGGNVDLERMARLLSGRSARS